MKSLNIACVLLLVFFLLPYGATAQVIERVSVSSDGVEGDGESRLTLARWQVSDHGRYVVFESDASNLVANDANGVTDIFVRDLELRTTTRVSESTDGSDADGPSVFPVISGDGRFVAFNSEATNLVEGDTNGVRDVFVRDLLTGETTRINLSVDGGEADENSSTPSLNYDGRSVAFASSATNLVAEAGVYICKVIDRKISRGKVILVCDGGLHHHLAAAGLFGQVIRKNYPVVVANKITGPHEKASVVGPLCTPLDLLADNMQLSVAEPGDLIAVFQSGAYGRSASPLGFLSHPPPVELLV